MIITETQYKIIKKAFADAKTERQKISVSGMALNELGIYRSFFGKIKVKLILSKDYNEFCAMVYKKAPNELKPKRVKKPKREAGVYSKNGKKHAENLEFIKSNLGVKTIFEMADELGFDHTTVRRIIIKNKVSMDGVPDYNQIMKARNPEKEVKQVIRVCKNGKTEEENVQFIKDSLGIKTMDEIAKELGYNRTNIWHIIKDNNISMEGVKPFHVIMQDRREVKEEEKQDRREALEAERKKQAKIREVAEVVPKKVSKARIIGKEDNKEKAGRIARIVTDIRKKESEKVRLGKIVEAIKKQVTTEKIRVMIGKDTFYICPQKYNTPAKIQAFIEKQEARQRADNEKFTPKTHKLWK